MTYPHRVAMISMHTSPLATPGVGDAGGLNVYVQRWPAGLANAGSRSMCSPGPSPSTTPDRRDERAHPGDQRPGRSGPSPSKEELPGLVHAFVAQLDAAMPGYDLIHSHYWLSGLVGVQLAARHQLPLVHTMHTMARVKNAARGEDQLVEPDDRERGEAAIVAAADALTANTTDEPAELRRHYGARSEQIAIVPPGVDLHTFHPVRPAEIPGPVRRGPGRAGDLVRRPDPAAQGTGHADPRRGRARPPRPRRRDRLRLIIIGSPSGPDRPGPRPCPAGRRARGRRPGGFRPHSSAPSSSAGTASPTSSACRPTPSRSVWSRWRPRPAAARWSPPTSAACGRPWSTADRAAGGRRTSPVGGPTHWPPCSTPEEDRVRMGRQRRRPRLDLQLGQHRRGDPAGVRARDRRTPVADAQQSGQRRGAAIGRHSG